MMSLRLNVCKKYSLVFFSLLRCERHHPLWDEVKSIQKTLAGSTVRACWKGGEGPQAGEVTLLGGLNRLSI